MVVAMKVAELRAVLANMPPDVEIEVEIEVEIYTGDETGSGLSHFPVHSVKLRNITDDYWHYGDNTTALSEAGEPELEHVVRNRQAVTFMV